MKRTGGVLAVADLENRLEKYSPDKCGECVYLVDWLQMPGTSGESMARQGYGRWGCMRLVAEINGKRLQPCHYEDKRERQLSLWR
jgi:hypothetical protein